MITIDDENRILNINYMAIYLMLTAKEMKKYGDKLKGLNRYSSLTRGIFHFEIVEKGKTPYEELPAEMTRNVSKTSNVLVRFINNIHSIYRYGLDTVDLTKDIDHIVDSLKQITAEICRKNIQQLDILSNRPTSTAIQAVKEYESANIVKDVFERVLKGETIAKEESPVEPLQTMLPSSDFAESLQLAKEAIDSTVTDKIERERCERVAPAKKPDISLRLKLAVPNGSFYKDGNPKRSFGLEVVIDGDVVNIPITRIDEKMIYTSLLIATREGVWLKRRDFSTNAEKEGDGYRLMRRVFESLPLDDHFDDWFEKVNSNAEAYRINNAKSKVNNLLWNHLSLQHKDAYHYLCIVTAGARTTQTRYKMRLRPEQIVIDDPILENYEN